MQPSLYRKLQHYKSTENNINAVINGLQVPRPQTNDDQKLQKEIDDWYEKWGDFFYKNVNREMNLFFKDKLLVATVEQNINKPSWKPCTNKSPECIAKVF